jgi:hypothetical protein
LRRAENPSTQKRKRYGEIGPPCRKPLDVMKGEDKSPFNLTANLTVGCHRLVAHNNNPVRSVVRRIHNGADLRSPFQNSFDKGFVLPNGHVCSKKKKKKK